MTSWRRFRKCGQREKTVLQISRIVGLSRPTIYRVLQLADDELTELLEGENPAYRRIDTHAMPAAGSAAGSVEFRLSDVRYRSVAVEQRRIVRNEQRPMRFQAFGANPCAGIEVHCVKLVASRLDEFTGAKRQFTKLTAIVLQGLFRNCPHFFRRDAERHPFLDRRLIAKIFVPRLLLYYHKLVPTSRKLTCIIIAGLPTISTCGFSTTLYATAISPSRCHPSEPRPISSGPPFRWRRRRGHREG